MPWGKLLLRTIVSIGILIAFAFAWAAFTTKTRVVSTASGDYLPRHLSEGSTMVQPITAAKDRLGAIALAFERGTPSNLSAATEIRVRIFRLDARGAYADPDKPLFEKILASEDIMAYSDTVLPIRFLHVEPGSALAIEIKALRLDAGANLAIRTADSADGGLVENGVARSTIALYTVITYNNLDYGAIGACVLLAALVLLLAFDVFRPLDRWVSRARFVPLFISPLFVIAIMELLNTLNTKLTLPPVVFLFTYLIVLGFTFFFYFLSRQVLVAIFLTDIVWVTFASINHAKIYFRGDPLYSGDLALAGAAVTALDNLQFQVSPRVLAAILILFAGLLVFRKDSPRPRRSWRMPVSALAVAVAMAGFVGFVVCNDVVMQNAFGINRYTWNQMTNYKKNGFLLSFAGSIANLSIEIPVYNQPDLAGLYDIPAPAANAPPISEKPHIIVVMSESYADFRNVRKLPVSEPVMPFFDSLTARDNVISGNLLVSIFGGGTCNTEFEYLTGGSMLFLQDGIIPYRSYMQRPTHSICDLLELQGYRTVAVHPYIRTFWDRDTVYPNLEFDKFVSMESFQNPEIVRNFISDQSCFERVIQEFEATPDDERLFLYAVTMQNHFPYYVDEETLAALDYHISLNGMTGMESAEMYLSLLRKSDDALKYMVNYFEAQDEPVILVFFGDHLPGNNQEFMPFYSHLFGTEIADLNIVETRKMYETPFFIWSNRDLPADQIDTISPNLLSTYVLGLAGARMSPYFQYIDSLRDSISAINSKTILDSASRAYDRADLPASLQKLLNRYWVYEYDNIVKK
ncbi:MAG TPA: LTA synthase family protein, partial [Clostridia bacterium]